MADATPLLQTVERDGKQYRTISEGKASILVPHGAKIGSEKDKAEEQQVFYNPIQQYNRDLSTLAVKVYGEMAIEKRKEAFESHRAKQSKKRKRDESEQDNGAPGEQTTVNANEPKEQPENDHSAYRPSFKILDALSASGLRALRYSLEIPYLTSVVANDLSASAAESIKLNVEHNGVTDKVSVTNDDALAVMYRSIAADLSKKDKRGNPGRAHKFDVVDLDPYGTAAPFFDAAVQSVRDDGGLLVVTCTDSAVWAGHAYCEKSFALYGGIPVKGLHSHEVALRLILNSIATSGARYGLAIEPLLSLSIDFYTKVFVKVTRSPSAVKFLGAKTMLAYSCDQGCGSWETQPILKSKATPNKKGSGSFYKHTMALAPTTDRFCQHCGFKMHLSGPMYGGHIHSQEFIQRLLEEIPKVSPEVYGTLPRLEGMLRTALEELIPGPEPPAGVDPKDAEYAVVDHTPFFFIPGRVSSVLSCTTPTDDLFRGAILHLGYRVGRSHCRGGSIKTDAPWSTIWWILTEWIKQKSPVKVSKFQPNMAAWKILYEAGILAQDKAADVEAPLNGDDAKMENTDGTAAEDDAAATHSKSKANGAKEVPPAEAELRKTLVFDDALAKLGRGKGIHYMRYQINPQKNWGPLSKAKAN